MKIQIISDLHQEFGTNNLIFNKADVIVFAGDINIGVKGVLWMKKEIKETPIIYVLGNHEYYKGTYPKTLHKIKEMAEGSNIHVLENESIKIGGVNFHGATLWSDFSLLGNSREYGMICQERMNDYKKIRRDPTYSKLRSVDVYNIHKESRRWLKKSLEKSIDEVNIVVTHHAPSIKSIPEKYKKDPITSAYASDLEELIKEYAPKYWIHGHVHTPKKYSIEKTKVICNPHGYIDDVYNGYEKELIIEI